MNSIDFHTHTPRKYEYVVINEMQAGTIWISGSHVSVSGGGSGSVGIGRRRRNGLVALEPRPHLAEESKHRENRTDNRKRKGVIVVAVLLASIENTDKNPRHNHRGKTAAHGNVSQKNHF